MSTYKWRWHRNGWSSKSHLVDLHYAKWAECWEVYSPCGWHRRPVTPQDVWGMPNGNKTNPCKRCLAFFESEATA
jgi:hypothetical protein